MAQFNENSKLGEIMADEGAMAIMQKHMGDFASNPMVGMMKDKTMAELIAMIPMPDMKEKLQAVVDELKQ